MSGAMRANDFDVSNVTLSSIRSLDNGGKLLYLNYGAALGHIYLQTPEVSLPFDPKYFADNDNSGKYSVQVSMKGMEDNASLQMFHDKLCELDTFLKNKAMENSVAWFKKSKMSMETIESLYTPQIKVSTDPETGEPNGKYAPRFGFKVVKKDGEILCSVYDNQKTVFDVNGKTEEPTSIANVLMKGSLVKAVLKCNGVWIANGKFGCTWRAEQIRVKVPEGGLRDFAILSDSDDEGESVEQETTTNLIEDSDEEENVVEEVKPTPPKTVKKKTRKVSVKSSA